MTTAERLASLEIGAGKANTDKIRAKCTTVDIAADVADKYFTSTAGAGQWFLPSRKELDALCLEFFKGGYGGQYTLDKCKGSGLFAPTAEGASNGTPWSFPKGNYWSSSEAGPEDDAYNAWNQDFASGGQFFNSKFNTYYVRPVRAF